MSEASAAAARGSETGFEPRRARSASRKRARPGRFRRRLVAASIISALFVGASWIALHELPWLGPLVADGARAVVGPRPVAWIEDAVYGVEDAMNVVLRGGERPKTFWTDGPAPAPGGGAPPPFAPPVERVAAAGDGTWVGVRAVSDPAPIAMYKTLVHPDARRPFAAVAIVAIDVDALALTLVAGTEEPESDRIPATRRPGTVPAKDRDRVVAVFNGGFKAVHGRYGMRIGTDSFVPPRDTACTIAITGGRVRIGTWTQLETDGASAYRQTPPCLVENGAPNPDLSDDDKSWGASVSGATIIRRSALGLSADGRWLFYALGDAVSARTLGEAIHAAGAHTAAQLDVNYAFPRFLLVERGAGTIEVNAPLVPDLRFNPSDYVVKPSDRDFFYVSRRAAPDRADSY